MRLVYKYEGKDITHTLNKEGTTIGRTENNTIHLDDNSCSRNHCVIEYRDKKYRITDLRSFNGIKVNGEKVTSHILEDGDVITIGKTVFTYEDLIIPDQCSVTATHLRKVKQPTIFTEVSKWREVPYAKPFVVGLIFLFMASLVLRFVENYNFYFSSIDQYEKVLTQEVDSKKAIQKFIEITEVMPGTFLEKACRLAINRINEKDTYFENANEILFLVRIEYDKQNYSPKKYINILQSLLAIYSHEAIVAPIYKELERARTDYETQIKNVYSGVQAAATVKLEDGDYNLALKYYQNFIKDYPIESWRERADFEITRILVRQSEDWSEFQQKIQALQSKNNFLEARMLVLIKYESYINTPLANQIQELLESLKEDTTLVAVKRKEKKDVYVPEISNFISDENTRKLLYKGEWEEVISKLKYIYQGTKEQGSKQLIKEYITDFENIDALQKDFLANWKSLKDLHVPIANKEARIKDIKNNVLNLGLTGELGTIQFKWESLPVDVKVSLLEKIPFSENNGFALASLSAIHSQKDNIHRTLIDILNKVPKSKTKVDQFYSRWTGIPIPEPDGFIVFRDLLIHPQEKVLVEYKENISDFCRKQGGNPNASFSADLARLYDDIRKVPQLEIKDDLINELGSSLSTLRKKLLQNIHSSFDFAAVKYLQQLKIELDKRREFALTLIFDEKTYPADETKGAAAQPDVDKRVAAVREIWDTPSKGIEKLSPKILESKKAITTIDSFLGKEFSGIFTIAKEDDLASLDAFIDGRLDIKNYAEDPKEQERINYNKRIMAENDSASNGASATEKQQVAITNNYRHMMGRYAVKVNEPLTSAARKHSVYLRANNLFAHNVPGHPDGETPAQRARNSGYTGSGTGENIYMGRTSPQEAHNGWVHSAGHHRNILHPMWRSLGSGQDSNYWTQNFGNQ